MGFLAIRKAIKLMTRALCPLEIHSHPKVVKVLTREIFFHFAAHRGLVFHNDTIGLAGNLGESRPFLIEICADGAQDLRKTPSIAHTLGFASARATFFIQTLDVLRSVAEFYSRKTVRIAQPSPLPKCIALTRQRTPDSPKLLRATLIN